MSTADVDREPGSADRAREISDELTSPRLSQDPYPLYRELRAEHPVFRATSGAWYVSRYADVKEVLRDPRLSNARMIQWVSEQAGMSDSELQRRVADSLMAMDPPGHSRLRKLVGKAFNVRWIATLRTRVEEIVAETLDAATAEGDRMDVLADFAKQLPVAVICEVLGVPDTEKARIVEWYQRLDEMTQSDVGTSMTAMQRVEQMAVDSEDFLLRLIEERRERPAGDLLSGLVSVREDGDELTDSELVATCFTLLFANFPSPADLVGNGVLALLRNPAELRRLRTEPALLRSTVDELLRFDSPVQMIGRITVSEMEIAGSTLAPGDVVFSLFGSANRDPDRFQNPDRLDITREDQGSLSFGVGPHYCIGAPLARMQTEIAIRALFERLPGLRLETDEIAWRPNPMGRGLVSLPVTY